MSKEEENNTLAEVTYARLVSHFSHHQTTFTNGRERDDRVARMHSLSRVLDEFTGPVERRTIGVRSVVCIAKKLIERGGDEENNSVEKKHFGYSILQRLLLSKTKTSSPATPRPGVGGTHDAHTVHAKSI